MFAGDGSSDTGTQKSMSGDGKRKPRGMTPTTVQLALLSIISWPINFVSPPNRRCHKP